jgi:acetolactate synthase-1/2/3 large subunit
MNGAEAIFRTARAAGIDVCFANPGTTEMRLVAALDSVPGMRAVLGLFEGVCTGAADGYARMSDRPALTLLHLGPGFANGIANLHNARRAHSPVINLIGDHATWHLAADAPLTSDIESLARPVGWVRRCTSASSVGTDMAAAIQAACAPPGAVASLIVPDDLTWDDASDAKPPASSARAMPAPSALEAAAAALAAGPAAVLFLGGRALRERGLRAAARIAAATGCVVQHEIFPGRMDRGGSLPAFVRFPYFPEQGLGVLAGMQQLVLAGTRAPVAFFGYPGMPSSAVPEGCAVTSLAAAGEDAEQALEALAERVGAPASLAAADVARPAPPTAGPLTVGSFGQAIAALQPDGAVVVDEAATSGLGYFEASKGSRRHSLITLTGGAIGQGLPCAVGAAIACPDRRVIALQADGSGMYTLQSLWTMARENLDVTVVVCANRRYRILQFELMRSGVAEPGRNALSLTDLSQPVLDWTSLARGMGVPAVSVNTAEGLVDAFRRCIGESGPGLIEAVLE